MTCAIREGAEQKIWRRLKYFRDLKRKHKLNTGDLKVGVLGKKLFNFIFFIYCLYPTVN